MGIKPLYSIRSNFSQLKNVTKLFKPKCLLAVYRTYEAFHLIKMAFTFVNNYSENVSKDYFDY